MTCAVGNVASMVVKKRGKIDIMAERQLASEEVPCSVLIFGRISFFVLFNITTGILDGAVDNQAPSHTAFHSRTDTSPTPLRQSTLILSKLRSVPKVASR
jgi:hypothetical protein